METQQTLYQAMNMLPSAESIADLRDQFLAADAKARAALVAGEGEG